MKRQLQGVYTSVRWHKVDQYEMLKVCKVILNHIFKYIKYYKGEGVKIASYNLERKAKKY